MNFGFGLLVFVWILMLPLRSNGRLFISDLRRVKTSGIANKYLQQHRVNHRSHPVDYTTTCSQRSFFFWVLRGGADSIVNTDVSQRRITVDKILNLYPISACSVQGHRSYMEDELFVNSDFCAVFDGHGGKAVSRYLRQNLYASMQASLPFKTAKASDRTRDESNSSKVDVGEMVDSTAHRGFTVKDYEIALLSALDKVNREVQRIRHWSFQGSTALAVWFHEAKVTLATMDDDDVANEESNDSESTYTQRTLVVANVGDSRAVLSRGNATALELTIDHKPDHPLERARIEALGGTITWHGDIDRFGEPVYGTGLYRVKGNLALSRAIGDRSEKPLVTATPDITITPLEEGDDFLVLATDGLWDVMSSGDVVSFVKALLATSEFNERERIASLLVEEALRRGTYDNVTVIIVWLQENAEDQ